MTSEEFLQRTPGELLEGFPGEIPGWIFWKDAQTNSWKNQERSEVSEKRFEKFQEDLLDEPKKE